MFDSGRVMASVRTMSEIGSVIRYTDIDYNILPIPKFDANQKDYYCNVDTHCGVMLPAMNADTNFVGMMIEAMCCGTYNNVLRAYYEITLKEKLLQNRNDAAMLDIIQSSAQMWRDQIYVTQITQALPQILMEESMDFESYSAKNLSVSEKQIENWNAIFTNQ